MKTRPCIVVLAAGRGSRFDGPQHKLAQDLGGGSVLSRTVDTALATQLPVVVVTTEALKPLIVPSVASSDVVILPEAGSEPGLGMGRSIAAGVMARPDASGWLVMPGDMPVVRSSTHLAVAEALAHHAVAYAQHRGRRGHPVGFAGELYSELILLGGDEGARRLVARYPSFGVEVDDPGVLLDVDTVDDLLAVQSASTARPEAATERRRA